MATNGQISMGPCTNLDALRQRAQKAAEYYQQQQLKLSKKGDDGKSGSSQMSSQDYQILPQYADHYSSNHSLEAQSNSARDHVIGAKNIGFPQNNNKLLSGASSRASMMSAYSNNFTRVKMRDGILDLRSSYNERISNNAARARARTYHGPHTSSKNRTHTYALENKQPEQQQKSISLQQSEPQKQDRIYTTDKTIMSKSSNNMEVDSGELESPPSAIVNLHREYGSTSSLDILGTGSDNFFSMLNEFRQHYVLDQRSPAPPRLHELLRGRLESSSESHLQTAVRSSTKAVKFTNELTLNNKDSRYNGGPAKSNKSTYKERTQRAKSITCEDGVSLLKGKSKHKEGKQRAKSITDENSISILKKLRGIIDLDQVSAKTDNRVGVSLDSHSRCEEYSRRRAFVHFDCQSVGVDLIKIIHQRVHGRIYKSNMTSGASAASGQRASIAQDKDDHDLLTDTDEGDGKSNELVLSCPFFRNELGGEDERTVSLTKLSDQKHASGFHTSSVTSTDHISQVRPPACCGVSILDSSPSPSGQILPSVVSHCGHVIEYLDHGAYYYRHFFYTQDHQNFFGIDENLGPIAISVRREKLSPDDRRNSADPGTAQYRIICRTSELRTLRGCILEEAIPSRIANSRGIPIKEVLEVTLPEVQLSCLRQALIGQKTSEQLLKLDEQGISSTYKIGIMYCKHGQATEEEMYNNENSGPALEEFLNLISQKVRLKGFEKYRAGLDCKTDTTGTHSYYTTFNNNEIMFHVSTMLPYTPNNKQQLLRKRHIGNDIVTIVFQEPGALAFTPQTVRSQFQHVFIIVRVNNTNTEHTQYSIAVTRSKDVPSFGPHIPENSSFKKSQDFVNFLLAKVINAENAAHRSDKFLTMATRTREEYLKDLAKNYVTSLSLDSGSKFSKFTLGSGKKKEKSKQKVQLDMFAKGALVWEVQVEDMESASQVECLLAIAADTIVLVEQSKKDVIFTTPCSSVIGWAPQPSSLRLYFEAGEFLLFRPLLGHPEEIQEIIARLQVVTNGAEAVKLSLKRNEIGQLGFHIQSEGIVTDIEPHGSAWGAGLRKGSRLVEICKVATITLSHEQILDLLRTSAFVKVMVVSPLEDGSPRGQNSLDTKPPFTESIMKETSPKHHHHQQQHPQPQQPSSYKSSPMDPTDASPGYSDSIISLGHSSGDGRSYYHQELADMYRSLYGSREGFVCSGNKPHFRSNSHDSCSFVSSGVSSRLQSNQHGQPLLRRVERVMEPTGVSMDSGVFCSPSHSNRVKQTFSNMKYTSGTSTAGDTSSEVLKHIQNKKYLHSRSHGRSHDSLLQSHGSDSSTGSTTDVSQICEGSPQRFHGSGLGKLSKEESRQMNAPPTSRIAKPVMKKGFTEPPVASPRITLRHLSGISSEESLTSRLKPRAIRQKLTRQTAKDFQEELMRLIDPNLSENDLVDYSKSQEQLSHNSGQLQGTLSDDSLHSNKGLSNYRMDNSSCHRLSPRAVFDLTTAKQRNTGWKQQVSVNKKRSGGCNIQEEGKASQDDLPPSRSHSPQMNIGISSSPSSMSTSFVSLTNTSEQWIQELEQRLVKMSQELYKMRQKKAIMAVEMQHLQADNVRLQRESQTAAKQLRRFTEWFFKTVNQQ